MTIKKFRVAKPRNYTNKAGEEKTFWDNVGTLTVFIKEDGTYSRLLEIPAISLNAQVFEIKEEDEQDAV